MKPSFNTPLWIVVLGFAAAAGCSTLVGSGKQAELGGGGSDGVGGSGSGVTTGSGNGSSCDTSCDCPSFCTRVKDCYYENFDMTGCVQDCETNLPHDLRQCVCDANYDCNYVHNACEQDSWSAGAWSGGGGASPAACRACSKWAASGACYLVQQAYNADPDAGDIQACLDQCGSTTDCLIHCEHIYAPGVVDWEGAVGCQQCDTCAVECAGSDVYEYLCGGDTTSST
jgi:hypothetical protein